MLNKKSLSEQIYDSLKQDILDQKIKFGAKLINKELRLRYGVSSTPVRDAINRLHQDGLLDDISNSGARIIDFNYRYAIEINGIISMLSAEAVKMSAKQSEASVVTAVLREHIERQLEEIDSPEYFEYDRKFHETFFDFSKNESLKKLYSQYQTMWEILVVFYYKDQDSTRINAISQHRQIVDAYEQGNILLAQRRLEQHYQDAVQPLSKIAVE